jgi:hypothetical protein
MILGQILCLPRLSFMGQIIMQQRLEDFIGKFVELRPKDCPKARIPTEGKQDSLYLHNDEYQNEYRQFARFLFVDSDALDGVESKFEESSPQINPKSPLLSSPTGLVYSRMAYKAKPLAAQYSADHILREKNYMLQRVTATVRGLDYQLQCLINIDGNRKDHYMQLRNQLKKNHLALVDYVVKLIDDSSKKIADLKNSSYLNKNRIIKNIEKNVRKQLKKMEITFNSMALVSVALDSGLCASHSVKEISEFLLQTRLLSSLIDPAPSMRTFSELKTEGFVDEDAVNLVQIEHPITVKTDLQRERLGCQNNLSSSPVNYHAKKSSSLRLVNALHLPLMLRDDRALPAQSRKTHAPTVKNGFISHMLVGKNHEEPKSFKAVRHASLAYVGRGETDGQKVQDAVENFKQIFGALDQHGIDHENYAYQLLVTDYGPANLNHETEIIKTTQAAVDKVNKKENTVRYSHVPVNGIGSKQSIQKNFQVIDEVNSGIFSKFINWLFSTKKKRAQEAADLGLKMQKESGVVGGNCASGQDREGTHLTLMKKKFIAALQSVKEKFAKKADVAIEEAVIGSRHPIVINHLLAPGSAGHKNESSVPGLFGEAASEQMYTKAANTNKKVALNPKAVERTVKLLGQKRQTKGVTPPLGVINIITAILNFLETGSLSKNQKALLLQTVDRIWQTVITAAHEKVTIEDILNAPAGQYSLKSVRDQLISGNGSGDKKMQSFLGDLQNNYKDISLSEISETLERKSETTYENLMGGVLSTSPVSLSPIDELEPQPRPNVGSVGETRQERVSFGNREILLNETDNEEDLAYEEYFSCSFPAVNSSS